MPKKSKVILDTAFGKLALGPNGDKAKKQEKVPFFNKEYTLNIIVGLMTVTGGYMVSPAQRASYKAFKSTLRKEKRTMTKALLNYTKKNIRFLDHTDDQGNKLPFDLDTDNLQASLNPKYIIFKEGGQWGVVCETKYKKDLGLVLYYESATDTELQICIQAEFV